MLDKILQNIEKESKKEIERIVIEQEKEESSLEKEFTKKKQEKIEKETILFKEKIDKEIEELEQKKSSLVGFRLQEEKKKIVENVYEKAKKRVDDFSDEEYKKLATKLLTPLKGLKGDIFADNKTAKFLEKFGMKVTDTLKEKGLVFKSKDMDVDLTISRMLLSQKEKTDPEIINILFYA